MVQEVDLKPHLPLNQSQKVIIDNTMTYGVTWDKTKFKLIVWLGIYSSFYSILIISSFYNIELVLSPSSQSGLIFLRNI